MADKERLSFEEALQKLETVVRKLEDPQVTLEESLALYESGINLSSYCSQTLEEATLRIDKINDKTTKGATHSDENGL